MAATFTLLYSPRSGAFSPGSPNMSAKLHYDYSPHSGTFSPGYPNMSAKNRCPSQPGNPSPISAQPVMSRRSLNKERGRMGDVLRMKSARPPMRPATSTGLTGFDKTVKSVYLSPSQAAAKLATQSPRSLPATPSSRRSRSVPAPRKKGSVEGGTVGQSLPEKQVKSYAQFMAGFSERQKAFQKQVLKAAEQEEKAFQEHVEVVTLPEASEAGSTSEGSSERGTEFTSAPTKDTLPELEGAVSETCVGEAMSASDGSSERRGSEPTIAAIDDTLPELEGAVGETCVGELPSRARDLSAPAALTAPPPLAEPTIAAFDDTLPELKGAVGETCVGEADLVNKQCFVHMCNEGDFCIYHGHLPGVGAIWTTRTLSSDEETEFKREFREKAKKCKEAVETRHEEAMASRDLGVLKRISRSWLGPMCYLLCVGPLCP